MLRALESQKELMMAQHLNEINKIKDERERLKLRLEDNEKLLYGDPEEN